MPRLPSSDPIFQGLSSYWVVPGKLLAGAHPGFTSASDVPAVLEALRRAGVEVFVDLTEPGESTDYRALLNSVAGPSGRPIEYRQLGFRDMSVPAPRQMVEALDLVDASIREGRVAYVHCLGGLGRTGMVVGCRLARHGIQGDQALERIAELREHLTDAFDLSPVTHAQRRFVSTWPLGA